VALAQQLWQSNNVARARDVLAGCPKEDRGWEWRYLDRLCRAERYTLQGENLNQAILTFSPDGRLLVASETGNGQWVRILEAATGRELLVLKQGVFSPAVFSADGKRLALGQGHTVLVLQPDPDQPA